MYNVKELIQILLLKNGLSMRKLVEKMNNQGYESVILGFLENNKIIAASLVLIRKENGFKYAYSPKGYLLDYENYQLLNTFSNYIKKYLSKKKVMGIKINPLIIKNIYKSNSKNEIQNPSYDYIYNQLILSKYYHLGYNNFFESLKPRFEAVIDLDKPIDTLFSNIKREYRTKIRTCYKKRGWLYQGFEALCARSKRLHRKRLQAPPPFLQFCPPSRP